jgi:hypothetical protein
VDKTLADHSEEWSEAMAERKGEGPRMEASVIGEEGLEPGPILMNVPMLWFTTGDSLSICDLAKIFMARNLGLGAMLRPLQHTEKIFRLLHTLIQRFFVERPGLLARYRHLNCGFEVF